MSVVLPAFPLGAEGIRQQIEPSEPAEFSSNCFNQQGQNIVKLSVIFTVCRF